MLLTLLYKMHPAARSLMHMLTTKRGNGTALFTCKKRVDYTITFCPSDDLYQDFAVLPDGSTVSQGTGKPAPTVAVTKDLSETGQGNVESPKKEPKDDEQKKEEPKKEQDHGGNETTDAQKPTGGSQDKKDDDKDLKPSPTGGTGTADNSPKETSSSNTSPSGSPNGSGSGSGSGNAGSAPDDSSSPTTTTTTNNSNVAIDDNTILGMPQNWAIGLIVGVVVLLIIVIGMQDYTSLTEQATEATPATGQIPKAVKVTMTAGGDTLGASTKHEDY
ncbi:hypothetical protein OIV83_003719 [Microbotryomycetes sp. JL201]|nr:hypothetical protein OIV83_003719 [Microbotryomycetes sp. JL201]